MRLFRNDKHTQKRLSKKRKKRISKYPSEVDLWVMFEEHPARYLTAGEVYDQILHKYLPGIFAERTDKKLIRSKTVSKYVQHKFANRQRKELERQEKRNAEAAARDRPEKTKQRTPSVLLALRSTNRLEDLDYVGIHPRTRNHRYPRLVCRKLCRRDRRLLAVLEAKAAVHIQPAKVVRPFLQSTLIVQPGEKREQARRRRQMERISLKRELAGRVVAAPSE